MAEERRRTNGRETWTRLREWDTGSASSERMTARILAMEGFVSIDPSHPLGGRDGGKDILCARDDKRYLAACYFPRGEQSESVVREKFESDVAKAKNQKVDGMIFVTNQEITLAVREAFRDRAIPLALELYHLERLAGCLDVPQAYGLRLEFLDIEMTKEEQISSFAMLTESLSALQQSLASLTARQVSQGAIQTVSVQTLTPDLSTSAYTSIFPTKIKTCTCGEVFRAIRNISATTVVSLGYGSSVDVVTCPNCKRTFAF